MTANHHGKSRRQYSYGFEYKVHGGEVAWQVRVNDGLAEKDLTGKFEVSTMGPGETFEQRVVNEIHRAVEALQD